MWEPKTRVSINMKDTRRNSRKRRSRRRTNQHKLSVLVITGVIFLMTALVVVGGIFSSGEGEKLFGSGDGA